MPLRERLAMATAQACKVLNMYTDPRGGARQICGNKCSAGSVGWVLGARRGAPRPAQGLLSNTVTRVPFS